MAAAEVRLAALDYRAGARERAYERLDRVAAQDRTNLPALLARTSFLASEGKLDEAFASASAAAQAYPDSAAALFELGRVQAARHQTDAAIKAFSTVIGLNPRATDAKMALARLHLAAGNPASSIGLAQETLAAEPDNADARLMLVRSLIARRDLARAEAELASLAARFPDSAAVNVQQGILFAMRKDLDGARRHFDRALAANPRSHEAFGGLVGVEIAAGRKAEARARLDARVAEDGADAQLLAVAARAYLALQDPAAAERILRRVVVLDPADLSAYGTLAQIYVAQGRLDEALAEFEELARRDARPIGALTFAGMVLQAQGKTSEAQTRYERALALDPQAPVAANNLAWIYAHSDGNLDTALQLARTAYGALRETPEVGDTLGVIYLKREQLPEAIEVLKSTVAKSPATSEYHYHLGQAYAKAGERAAAIEHLERALALDAKFDGAADARVLLDSLR
jgi:tetratricopeptide (TPR) repeat protein